MLHLSLPTSPTAPHSDTVAMVNMISELRAYNRRLDDMLNFISKPLQAMTPMGADADGVSRGLVGGDDLATYVIYLDAGWSLAVAILPRDGAVGATEQAMRADVPARLRRRYGPTLGPMAVAA